MKNELTHKTKEELQKEIEELRFQLTEANETIDAIRTGQIDALVVQGQGGHQLYTLKSADQTYRVFIEKMAEGAVTINPKGLILYCNSQFASMVHHSLSEVIGMPFDTFVADENKAHYRELFQKCWKDDCKGEVLLISGESQTPVQLSLTTLQLAEGISLSIILTDLTAQKKTQQQLLENNTKLEDINHALEISNHDLQQFASIASHDLQEPLRKIIMFSNLIKDRSDGLTTETKKHLQKVIDSSIRMKTLIIDILTYSKLSANDFYFECIDLNEMLDELKEDFELIIEEKNAQIVVSKLPCLYVNKGQIRQVFQNIISNALKFAKVGVSPLIEVASRRIAEKAFNSRQKEDGPYCLISIRDNGIGFDEKYVQNIFSLFQRLNTKDRYEGTGIGLAIAKRIVEKHKGLITALSKENEGAEFQVILPMSQGND
ncbi:PAS/PAC sensor signal transduction histidine kinase [Cnuella takakiae]|uniref:histidine kinase n=1 Tax=Cnuella takakiae TaxID=1302690 RepID=A0A1M4Z2Z0_9BACT|nr:ATP-binding protein [Cnuella takakiae]OLY94346.1 PAS domain-containing sensor histidine kinase [Cnuella takakiae]SHF12433.1 PAS/PAC sensor signal transduction histidine kinase [Cnuella takakiae]